MVGIILVQQNIYQLLDEVEQNIVICQRRADQLFAEAVGRDIDKSRYFAITEFNDCFIIRSPLLSLYSHCSFHKLEMSQQSLTAQGTDLLFSHKSVVSITHEQNITCSKILICRQSFAGHVLASRSMKRQENVSNDNYFCCPIGVV